MPQTLALCVSSALVAALAVVLACGPEKPPAPDRAAPTADPAAADAAVTAVLPADAADAILTYAGDRGIFKDTNKPAEVPDEAKGFVRVTLLNGPEPPPGRVWVTNLR